MPKAYNPMSDFEREKYLRLLAGRNPETAYLRQATPPVSSATNYVPPAKEQSSAPALPSARLLENPINKLKSLSYYEQGGFLGQTGMDLRLAGQALKNVFTGKPMSNASILGENAWKRLTPERKEMLYNSYSQDDRKRVDAWMTPAEKESLLKRNWSPRANDSANSPNVPSGSPPASSPAATPNGPATPNASATDTIDVLAGTTPPGLTLDPFSEVASVSNTDKFGSLSMSLSDKQKFLLDPKNDLSTDQGWREIGGVVSRTLPSGMSQDEKQKEFNSIMGRLLAEQKELKGRLSGREAKEGKRLMDSYSTKTGGSEIASKEAKDRAQEYFGKTGKQVGTVIEKTGPGGSHVIALSSYLSPEAKKREAQLRRERTSASKALASSGQPKLEEDSYIVRDESGMPREFLVDKAKEEALIAARARYKWSPLDRFRLESASTGERNRAEDKNEKIERVALEGFQARERSYKAQLEAFTKKYEADAVKAGYDAQTAQLLGTIASRRPRNSKEQALYNEHGMAGFDRMKSLLEQSDPELLGFALNKTSGQGFDEQFADELSDFLVELETARQMKARNALLSDSKSSLGNDELDAIFKTRIRDFLRAYQSKDEIKMVTGNS